MTMPKRFLRLPAVAALGLSLSGCASIYSGLSDVVSSATRGAAAGAACGAAAGAVGSLAGFFANGANKTADETRRIPLNHLNRKDVYYRWVDGKLLEYRWEDGELLTIREVG